MELKKGKAEKKKPDYAPLDDILKNTSGKRIYFSNTVNRLQETYDRLIAIGIPKEKITVLHNHMPLSWRKKAEKEVYERFGKESADGDWLLLTNQVVEAGLDISADLVISDPAPVDTLVQRAGRCARWFREKSTNGEFKVIKPPNSEVEGKDGIALPYKAKSVLKALQVLESESIKDCYLTWDKERNWVNNAWADTPKKAEEIINNSIDGTAFALNLFDRAAQEHKPGEIANVFREILSIEVAVEKGNKIHFDDLAERDLQSMLDQGLYPETSSISLGAAWG